MKNKILSRRSLVGYGYTTSVEQKWNKSYTSSWLSVISTTEPDYSGTIRQVFEMMSNDRLLLSFRSGGTSYSDAWFIRVRGKWHKITSPYADFMLSDLAYNIKSVVVEYD